MKQQVIIFFVGVLTTFSTAYADIDLQILHTSDIHSHYLNTTNPLRLGGVARIKTLVDQFRAQNENTLFLDAGDWSEAGIFFTIGSGEANNRLMEKMTYDAIVLGNHDWLTGPKELYNAFKSADMKVPVLSANLVTDGTSYNMREYIKPYIIKNVGGKKIGIFGLSTFQMVFDQFLEPYNVTPPLKAGKQTAQYLKNVEKCDVIIALSHMGIEADQYLAYAAPEISMIVGGHTHILLKKPRIVNGVPIVHIGEWGFYLGQYVLHIADDGKVSLKSHKVNQIDSSIPENLDIKIMVEGFQKVIEEKMGPVFTDKALYSDVDLPLGENQLEYTLGNWAADGLRAAVPGADIAIDNAHYRTKQLYRGWSHTGDFFELFPHTYSAEKNRAWNVYEFEVSGSLLRLMMSALFLSKGNGSLLSNANLVIDFNNMLQPVSEFKIGGKDVSAFKTYKVATTEGVIEALKFIKNFGLDLKFENIQDKGVEAWRAIQTYVVGMSPVTKEKAKWEGRIRSLQPDLMIVPESIDYQMSSSSEMNITFQVINAGMQEANLNDLVLKIDSTPQNTLDENWEVIPVNMDPRVLAPGESYWVSSRWNTTGKIASPYAIHISASPAEGEKYLANNAVESTVTIQEYSPYGLEGSFFRLPLPDLSPWKKQPKVSFGILKQINE